MATAQSEALYAIRASRADPPGEAGVEERRQVYSSALAQFEELLAAARQATPQTRPLSLFYALSQAGRAIAAAHGEGKWRLVGHGLTARNLDGMSPIDVMVEPRPMEKAWTTDSFGSVAKATGSETLSGPVSLGSLWASLPGLAELTDVPEHAQPLPVVPVEQRVDLPINLDKVPAVIVGIDSGEGEEVDKQEAEELLSYYPAGRMTTIFHPPGLPSPQRQLTGRGSGLSVWWPADSPDYLGHQRTLDRYAPYDQYTGERWLRPALEDGQLPAPLIVWWALLFALSMLARYEPAAWAAALDYDESGLAAPLAQLLEAGVDLVPQLVLSALFRQA